MGQEFLVNQQVSLAEMLCGAYRELKAFVLLISMVLNSLTELQLKLPSQDQYKIKLLTLDLHQGVSRVLLSHRPIIKVFHHTGRQMLEQ